MTKEIIKELQNAMTYRDFIHIYLKGLVGTYRQMGYTVTEISIASKDSGDPEIFVFTKESEKV